MYFLIGVVVLILFIVFCYFFVKKKISSFTMKYLGTTDIKGAIEAAQIEDQEVPLAVNVENENIIEIEDEEVPLSVIEDEEIIEIEDEETPLAANAKGDGEKKSLPWWLLAIPAGIAGKMGYDKQMKKRQVLEDTNKDGKK